jgi:DNA-binding transcriptional regulator/RsmH inhibitor MraZ
MTRGIEQRLRKLELGSTEPRRLQIVFSTTSDEADWDSQIADLISSGHASAADEFLRIGWGISRAGRTRSL